MELSQAQEDDLRRVLKQHPIGISTEALSRKVNSFVDRQELALGLHVAKQQGWVYKTDGLYFLVNSEATKEYEESLVKPDTPIAEVHPVAVGVDPLSNICKKVVEAKVKEPVKVRSSNPGNLKRSKFMGAAALALYKFRDYLPLCLDEIVELTGATKGSLYPALIKLLALGYIEKDSTVFLRPLFHWTGKFTYPFKQFDVQDADLLRFKTVIDYHNFKHTVTPQVDQSVPTETSNVGRTAIVEPKVNTVSDPVSDPIAVSAPRTYETPTFIPVKPNTKIEEALRLIDVQMEFHRHQLSTLTTLRDTLTRG